MLVKKHLYLKPLQSNENEKIFFSFFLKLFENPGHTIDY